VCILLLATSLPLVVSKDTCDNNAIMVGKLGPMLRANVHIEECQSSGRCESRFNFSLARGEQYRDTINHISMILWGTQVCMVTGKLTGKLTEDAGGTRSFQCTSACYYPHVIPSLGKEGFRNCTSVGNSTKCTLGGIKSWWNVNMTDASLSEDNTTVIDVDKTQCSAVSDDPTPGEPFTLTFEDCINVTSASGKSNRHRCDKVQIFDEDSRKILGELEVQVGQKYNHLVIVGEDTYGHDHYLTAWNNGRYFCVGTRVIFKKMYKVKEFSNNVQEVTRVCMHSCGEKVNKNAVTQIYYDQKWDTPSDDDLKIVKYIKVGMKSENRDGGGDGNVGNGGDNSFGNFVQSKPMMILTLITVVLCLKFAK